MIPDPLDTLISYAVACAELGNCPLTWVLAGCDDPRLAAVVAAAGQIVSDPLAERPPLSKAPEWTPAEDRFVVTNLGLLSDAEIGAALGRSANGVHIRWSRALGLPAPSKHPEWLTCNRVAHLLAVDGHAVTRWRERGLMTGFEPLPWLNQGYIPTYRIRRLAVWRWAADPMHWIYFNPRRVRDAHLRRLLELQARRWGDEWWTPSQVAACHGVLHTDVNRLIRRGEIRAVKWGNWRVLRSEATRPDLHFAKGRGAGPDRAWSEPADAFLVLARAVGLSTNAIAGMAGWSSRTISFRLARLHKTGQIPHLIEAYGLRVHYRPEAWSASEALFADWRDWQDRFPAIVRAVDRFLTGRPRAADLLLVRGVLWRWATWHAGTRPQWKTNSTTRTAPRSGASVWRFARALTFAGNASLPSLQAAHAELQSWGLEPLAP